MATPNSPYVITNIFCGNAKSVRVAVPYNTLYAYGADGGENAQGVKGGGGSVSGRGLQSSRSGPSSAPTPGCVGESASLTSRTSTKGGEHARPCESVARVGRERSTVRAVAAVAGSAGGIRAARGWSRRVAGAGLVRLAVRGAGGDGGHDGADAATDGATGGGLALSTSSERRGSQTATSDPRTAAVAAALTSESAAVVPGPGSTEVAAVEARRQSRSRLRLPVVAAVAATSTPTPATGPRLGAPVMASGAKGWCSSCETAPSSGNRPGRLGTSCHGVAPNGVRGGGYVLDTRGVIRTFSQGVNPPAAKDGPSWPGQDMARGIATLPDGSGGYVVDKTGKLYPFRTGSSPAAAGDEPRSCGRARTWRTASRSSPTGPAAYVLGRNGSLTPFAIGGNPKPPAATDGPSWPGLDMAPRRHGAFHRRRWRGGRLDRRRGRSLASVGPVPRRADVSGDQPDRCLPAESRRSSAVRVASWSTGPGTCIRSRARACLRAGRGARRG